MTLDRSIDYTPATPTAAPLQDKFAELGDQLEGDLVNRTDEIECAKLALVSRSHMFLLGPPGTGKSRLVSRLVKRIEGAQLFHLLMTRFTPPEEVFGPQSLAAFKEDRFARKADGYLPTADIANLEEVWKSNSAILNAQLEMLNERQWRNDGAMHPVPLSTMFCSSNELPQGEDLNALYDRIHFRLFVGRLTDDLARLRMFRLVTDPNPKPVITWAEVLQAQVEVDAIPIDEETDHALNDILRALRDLGIEPSERRMMEARRIAQAAAWMDGAAEAGPAHLEPTIHMWWERPEQRADVQRAVLSISSPGQKLVVDLADAVGALADQLTELLTRDVKERYEESRELQKQLAKAKKELKGLEGKVGGRAKRLLDDTNRQLEAIRETVITKLFGIEDLVAGR